jgi:hypothetical protein
MNVDRCTICDEPSDYRCLCERCRRQMVTNDGKLDGSVMCRYCRRPITKSDMSEDDCLGTGMPHCPYSLETRKLGFRSRHA